MSYRLLFDPQTDNFFKKHPKREAEKILKKLRVLTQNPFAQYNDLTKLKGTVSSYRLRIGNIRIIYVVNTSEKTISVAKIKPRGSAYKP